MVLKLVQSASVCTDAIGFNPVKMFMVVYLPGQLVLVMDRMHVDVVTEKQSVI